ncbi:MAG: ABC transporter ATP-binding protein [Bacillota bacterium]
MLQVKSGVFGYEKQRLLFDGIGFSLSEGEVLTILGPNGAGKTTLLKCVVGLLKWRSGQSLLEGTPISGIPAAELWKKISYVPQAKSFSVPFSVLDMVVMGRAPYIGLFSAPSKRDYDLAANALEELGINYLKDKLCSQISGGELQLALIARATVSNPRLIILDEPESHLDFKNQLVVLEKLKGIASKNKIACMINTHYPENALRISDKTLLLGKGQNYIFGFTREVITEDRLREVFGVRVKIVSFEERAKTYKTIYPVELAETNRACC